jgi:hypothetical protein
LRRITTPQTHHCLSVRARWCALFLLAAFALAQGQTISPADAKLPLKVALVLTPEFCATQTTKGSFTTKEKFEIGKDACAELEPALKLVFPNLIRVEAATSSGDAQVVLLPRFVDVGATMAMTAFSNREMVVFLEWTAKDISGKTVWIETVQGSAKHHIGNMFTYNKNRKLIAEDSVKDVAEQSASKLSSAPELRKLTQ